MFWFGFVIALLLVSLFVALLRANEVCVIAVRNRRCLIMRGRIPSELRRDIEDVIARAPVKRATLRVVRSNGKARMLAAGVDGDTAQRLRNVLGLVSDQKLRMAPPMKGRNLGQWLGLPWLAFRLASKGEVRIR